MQQKGTSADRGGRGREGGAVNKNKSLCEGRFWYYWLHPFSYFLRFSNHSQCVSDNFLGEGMAEEVSAQPAAAGSGAASEAVPAEAPTQFDFKPPTMKGLHPDMENPPSFYDWASTFPFLAELVANQAAIAAEAKQTKWWCVPQQPAMSLHFPAL